MFGEAFGGWSDSGFSPLPTRLICSRMTCAAIRLAARVSSPSADTRSRTLNSVRPSVRARLAARIIAVWAGNHLQDRLPCPLDLQV